MSLELSKKPDPAQKSLSILQTDVAGPTNPVIRETVLHEQDAQLAAQQAASNQAPNLGNSVVNSLTGEELVKKEVSKEATSTGTQFPASKPAIKQDDGKIPTVALVSQADEHVADVKNKYKDYIGKPGYNPFLFVKPLDAAHKAMKKAIASEESDTVVRAAAYVVLNIPFEVPDVSKRKFDPADKY